MGKFRLFNNNPPKKGISKKDERASVQTDFPGFFRMYGRKFWNLSNLNLLIAVFIVVLSAGVWYLWPYKTAFNIFIFLCIPVFGLFSVGTTYIVRGYVRGDPVYILSDFKYAIKNNWKQGIVLGIIDVIVVFLLVFDVIFWVGVLPEDPNSKPKEITQVTETNKDAELFVDEDALMDTPNSDEQDLSLDSDVKKVDKVSEAVDVNSEINDNDVKKAKENNTDQEKPSFFASVSFYACVFLLFIYIMMRNYMYIIAVTFKLSIFKIIKNSFIFAFLGIKRNILAVIGVGLVLYINIAIFFIFNILGVMLSLIITMATCSFIGAYSAYPVIKKYMITPYYDDEEVNENYDRIFTDRE